jgi:hypothetical protein
MRFCRFAQMFEMPSVTFRFRDWTQMRTVSTHFENVFVKLFVCGFKNPCAVDIIIHNRADFFDSFRHGK